MDKLDRVLDIILQLGQDIIALREKREAEKRETEESENAREN